MAESFGRWESDPLFTAAEVVQDSADRMESSFRMLLHEQSLAQGDPSDFNLLNLMKYHRRDLATALETTKWQLEDFEGAVNFAALSDKSNSRENAILSHRQFIRAIKEQILLVEKSVGDLSTDDFSRDSEWMNSNEQDTDGLALFLSGGDSKGNLLNYDSGNSMMRRFLNSTTDSDEIVELKTEEGEPSAMNGLKHSYHAYDTESCTVSAAYGLGQGDSGAKCYSYRSRLMESVWDLLRKIGLANKNKGSFTKRRKDGEVTDNLIHDDQRMPSSAANIPPADKSKNICTLWTSISRIHQGFHLESTRFYRCPEVIQRRVQRYRYLILYSGFPVRLASAIVVLMILLGLVAFYAL